MRYRILLHVVLTVLPAVGVVGCGHSEKSAAAADVLTASDAETLLTVAGQTLRQMHFVLDKYDVEAGYIRTRPQRAGQFFEPWRQDNASAEAFVQANMGSLMRTVEIFIEPEYGTISLRCVVTVEKLSLPPRPIRSMSRLAGMHTDSTRSVQTLALDRGQLRQIEWIDLGSDHALEQRLVSRIQDQLRKG